MRFVSIDRNWTVFWRKLDGLLKETELLLTETFGSIDGNKKNYWRKLHVLLKVTGRSINDNWMVWIRKLDCLLTETGWAIDGNWTVYWWKEWSIDGSSPADYLHFGGLKMRFYLFVKSTFQGYQAACQEIWRMYQDSCEEIFCILAVRKCDCCRFVKLTFQGTSQRVGIFLMFEAWKCDFAQSWN